MFGRFWRSHEDAQWTRLSEPRKPLCWGSEQALLGAWRESKFADSVSLVSSLLNVCFSCWWQPWWGGPQKAGFAHLLLELVVFAFLRVTARHLVTSCAPTGRESSFLRPGLVVFLSVLAFDLRLEL